MSLKLKIMFEDLWEKMPQVPSEERWLAYLDGFPGMIVTAPTKDKAFEEMMISIRVKVAYDSNYQLP